MGELPRHRRDPSRIYASLEYAIDATRRSPRADFTKLRRLDSAVVDATLTEAEVKAIAQHLGGELKQPADALTALVRRASVVDHERRTPEAELDAGRPPEPSDVVYERGFPANFATLVLSGKLSVKAGVDGFRAEAGPWTLLGAGALRDENFIPDFSAHVATDSVRCVYLSHAEKSNAPRRARKDDMRRSPSRERRRLRRDRRVGDRRGARSALGRSFELGRADAPRRRDPSSRSLSFDSPVRGTPPPVT